MTLSYEAKGEQWTSPFRVTKEFYSSVAEGDTIAVSVHPRFARALSFEGNDLPTATEIAVYALLCALALSLATWGLKGYRRKGAQPNDS